MEHPTRETLEAYCEGEVAEATVRNIEGHLADCSECAAVVANVVRLLVSASQRVHA
jgi:predicted anti-sigma-YlaC factor YlaD